MNRIVKEKQPIVRLSHAEEMAAVGLALGIPDQCIKVSDEDGMVGLYHLGSGRRFRLKALPTSGRDLFALRLFAGESCDEDRDAIEGLYDTIAKHLPACAALVASVREEN